MQRHVEVNVSVEEMNLMAMQQLTDSKLYKWEIEYNGVYAANGTNS